MAKALNLQHETAVPLMLPRFMIWQEVISLCAHLSPEDLAQLISTASWSHGSKDRVALWRAYFILHWGTEYGATRETQVRIMPSWSDADVWPGPWPFVVGFCGARSALDHMFWFLPFVRCAFRIERPPQRSPAPRRSQAWQVACHARCRGHKRLWRCFVCDVLEVVPAGPMPQHFRQHWVLPCGNCQRFAHRVCLERQLLEAGGSRGDMGAKLKLRCGACQREYLASKRFPESLPELLKATLQEWRWVLRRVFVMMCFFFWIYMLAGHYVAVSGVSGEICVVLLFTANIMSISVCERFHRGVQMIWNTPNKWRYLRLFGLYSVLCHLVVFRTLEPSHWEGIAMRQPWLASIHRLHFLIHSSFSGAIFLSGFSLLYISTASGAIFLFWKTSLRVPTVASIDLLGQNDALNNSMGGSQCGLCQLGLCLDNTCM